MKIANRAENGDRGLVSGERIVTKAGGFNPTWHRHSACYAFAAGFLGPGPVLDVGCGLGHARDHLKPRRAIGIDLDHASLVVQDRPTVVADMLRLPFGPNSFDSVVSIHAIEHVPQGVPAVREAARVLKDGGTAVFVTPNRLTFGRPDEIIDPYHYVEYDPAQLKKLCSTGFKQVEIYGIFGSDLYMQFYALERARLQKLLQKDPLKLRRFVPRSVKKVLYDFALTRARAKPVPIASQISQEDFALRSKNLDEALDVIAVCR